MRETLTYKPGVSVAIAAHDEAQVIADCLASVAWADEIIVVDGASSDGTADVARAYGARVVETTNKLMLNVNKNIAIDKASHEWILVLDPDERVAPELAEELRAIAREGSVHDGYWLPRRNYEFGVWIRSMGLYPDEQLRLFRNGSARFPCEHIHEMVRIAGATGKLHGELLHYPKASIAEYVHKRNLYSEHRAAALREQEVPFRASKLVFRPVYAFFKAYVLKRGFRDGVPGLIIAVSAGYGTFLQDAKLWEKWRQDAVAADAAPAAIVPAPSVDPPPHKVV